MARLLNRKSSVEIRDGSGMIAGAEALGIPLGCFVGMCGVCQVKVVAGQENLSRPSQAELDMELGADKRLACQAKVRKGSVRIRL